MSRQNIPALLQVPAEDHDLPWLTEALQWAVELEFATIPVYLSGMWSIKQSAGEVYNLIHSVVMEEMLHLGWACNMLTAIDGTPQITAPSYPGPLPGGIEPGFEVYLSGLNKTTVAMYMQIELPEHPVAAAETFPTIGAFYDAISAAFTALFPADHKFTATNQIAFSIDAENLTVLNSLDDVQNAILTIKEQGEGTSTSPDAPQFGGELAHYYRFGEILHEKTLIEVDGSFQYAGDAVPFPDCYPVATVPAAGYPELKDMQTFDNDYGTLIEQLQNAWSLPGTDPNGGSNGLGNAIGTMFSLTGDAQAIVQQPLPDGSGNYGPDFRPPAAGSAGPAVT